MKAPHILVVDGDRQRHPQYRDALAEIAAGKITILEHGTQILSRLEAAEIDLLIVAAGDSDTDTVELLQQAKQFDPNLPIMLVSAAPSIQTVTMGLRLGAGDFLKIPFAADELLDAVSRLLRERRVDDEHQLLKQQVGQTPHFGNFIGYCPAMRKTFEMIEQVAQAGVDVLILGETGTGKELVARAIHEHSARAQAPFVAVDCGALPENLLESEFFGYERGAFTGADTRRIGLIEFADRGTLFLDEVGELPLTLQAKLLRTLQERMFRRVGGRQEIPVDVGIIAATARNLDEMVQQRSFREDLFYRINVVRIELPALRERGDDLGLLAEDFAERYSREMGKPVVGISPEVYQVLSQYQWPGNVRELQNAIRRAIALSQDSMIEIDDLPDEVVTSAGDRNQNSGQGFFTAREEHVARFERDYINALLKNHRGNVTAAALEAKLPRGTLYRLMKNHGIESSGFRE